MQGQDDAYDAAGNLTADGSHTYFYDAENRLFQVDGSSGFCATGSGTAATMCYLYDAQGRRVRKNIGSTVKDYVFNLASSVVAEITPTMGWQVGYNYLNGQLQSEYRNNLIHADHLGSTRLLTDPTKAIAQNLDYLPFGENISTDSGISTHEFTGNQRDGESSLDHTLFRKYSFLSARWTSPDPLRGSIANPQSLNRYAYVGNNPMNLTDPTGLVPGCRNGCKPPDPSPCFSTCSSGGDSWYPDDNAFFAQMEYQMGCGTSPLANNCLTYASRPGPNGKIQVFLPGGKISYKDSLTGTSGDLTEFDGEWITLSAPLSADEQRIRTIGRGVVKGAGVVGDPKYIVGFYLVSATGGTVIAPEAPAVIIQASNTAATVYWTNEGVQMVVNFTLGALAAPGSQLPNTPEAWFGRLVGRILSMPEDW